MTAAPTIDCYQDILSQAIADGDLLLQGTMHVLMGAVLAGKEHVIRKWLVEAATEMAKDEAAYLHYLKTG